MGTEPQRGTAIASTAMSDGAAAGGGGLRLEAREMISERLSRLDVLYFPRAQQASAITPSQRCSLLLDLLSRDVAVFLERYGTHLTSDELQQFDALKDDYEVNWHINQLRSAMTPSSEELKSRSITVKNRRRAYMSKLISDGEYFSEDAMREREPYLHHEYLGRFQDPFGRSMARPGEKWSETLMRRSDEAFLVAEIRREQQRLGVAERDWVGNEINRQQEGEEEETEEEEEDSEDEEEEEEEEDADDEHEEEGSSVRQVWEISDSSAAADAANLAGNMPVESLSAMEMQEQMDQFTYLMQQKFLAGEDHKHLDYSKIDEDESLDDHWMREANHDAEDKYFSED